MLAISARLAHRAGRTGVVGTKTLGYVWTSHTHTFGFARYTTVTRREPAHVSQIHPAVGPIHCSTRGSHADAKLGSGMGVWEDDDDFPSSVEQPPLSSSPSKRVFFSNRLEEPEPTGDNGGGDYERMSLDSRVQMQAGEESSQVGKRNRGTMRASARFSLFRRRQLKKVKPPENVSGSQKDLRPVESLSWVRRDREESMQREKDLKNKLHSMLLQLPLQIDVADLKATIEAVEELDKDAHEMFRDARKKLKTAQDAQEKKRQAELKAERARLRGIAVEILKQQMVKAPLDVDCDVMSEQLKIAEDVDLATEDPAFHKEATGKFNEAAAAQKAVRDARRREAEAELDLQITSMISIDVPRLTEAYEFAKRADAAPEMLEKAQAALEGSRKRDEITAKLNEIMAQPPAEVRRPPCDAGLQWCSSP